MDLVEISGERDKFTITLSSDMAVYTIAFFDVFTGDLFQQDRCGPWLVLVWEKSKQLKENNSNSRISLIPRVIKHYCLKEICLKNLAWYFRLSKIYKSISKSSSAIGYIDL